MKNVGATDEYKNAKKWNIVLMTKSKVVLYDAKGTVLCFEAWYWVKNREGAVYALYRKNYINNYPNIDWNMLNFHRFWINWYQKSIPNVAH